LDEVSPSLLVWALKWVLQSVTLLQLQSPFGVGVGRRFAAADEPLAQR